MFSLIFNGRFELNDPDEFLQDMQELIKKHNVEYFGQIHSENLGTYIDFQKIDNTQENETTKSNEEV